MHVVEVQLALVPSKAAILSAAGGKSVVDAVQDRLAIAYFNELGRHDAPTARAGVARAIGPDAVSVLVWHTRMKTGARHAFAQRRNISDLREELLPALVRKALTRRTSL